MALNSDKCCSLTLGFQVAQPIFSYDDTLFYKQPVYKQVALGWQIAKQLPRLSPFSLSNNKNNRLKKSGVFSL